MGTIINTRREGDKIVSEVLSDYEEYLQLKGHLENVRLFSENSAEIQTNISQRGKNSATKYFLIPRQYRKGFKFNNATSCQKIDLGSKVVFVYIVDKLKSNPPKAEVSVKTIQEKYGTEGAL